MINRRFQYSLTLGKKIELREKYLPPLSNSYLNFPKLSKRPLLSVIIVQKNGYKYLYETLSTIEMQDFRNYELIVIDGASTDGSKEFLEGVANVRLISEPDNGMDEGFLKGLSVAKGKYVTHCCSSDGYLDPNWFSKAIKKLESDEDLSLVWGYPRTLDSEGYLREVSYPDFHLLKPFHKLDYFTYFLMEGMHFPEGNYVVALEVMKKCFPIRPSPEMKYAELTYDPWLRFVSNFHSYGFLSSPIFTVANYGRVHASSVSESDRLDNKLKQLRTEYFNQIRKIRKSVKKNGMQFYNRSDYSIKKYSSIQITVTMIKIRLLTSPVRLVRLVGKLF